MNSLEFAVSLQLRGLRLTIEHRNSLMARRAEKSQSRYQGQGYPDHGVAAGSVGAVENFGIVTGAIGDWLDAGNGDAATSLCDLLMA